MTNKEWPISQKLSFIILLTTSLSLVLALIALLANDFYIYNKEQKRKLGVLAEVISSNTQASVAFGDIQSAEQTLSALRADKHIIFAGVYGGDGKLFASYRAPNWKGGVPPDTATIDANKMKVQNFHSRLPIVLDGKQLGSLYLEADRKELEAIIWYYIRIAFGILVLSLLVAYGISLRLQRMIAEPILLLTELAKKVSLQRDYSVRIRKGKDDELGLLMDNFNLMLGEIQHRENTLKDIARKLADSNLELAQSNKDLEQFAYIASHDLQEPLRKIIAFSDRLKMGAATLTDEEKADSLTRMYNAGYRMKHVIEDLLQFSRASRHDLVFDETDLRAIVDDVMADLEFRISEAKAKIEVLALPQIRANKAQMRHLFQNLITNAIKFSKPGIAPEIRIEGGAVAEDFVEVRVRDNGIGFDEKYSEKIFKPFQRLHGRDEYEGTGIGLAIVEKIVHNHGGKIVAKSRPGEGALFLITLPKQPRPPQPIALDIVL